ncbi:uncharacterized protein LOC132759020 [Ruditapes philippinarum]|uniref:uncharacterized protein LOC132759020 n=1 Tax=Ruditapes philippinarum TaxID=129788 RepID=UPI00295ACBDD|nr:uncharacterized protein LOC132759020 [Ruditapes philippinarum]
MKLAICVLAVIVGLSQAADTTPAPKECMSDSDCMDTECCYKKHEFLIVSKKRQGTFEGYPINHQDLAHTKGVCQSYHDEGDHCSMYDKRNGYCSCNDKKGLSCQFVRHPVTSVKRQFDNAFGSYQCAKQQLQTVS